jgi:crotonobetainyl-CoA:carnitine CoA-transferase CaiB-like acyl-CoA transferase
LSELAEQLASPQLAHRGFFRAVGIGGRQLQAPGAPFGRIAPATTVGAPVRFAGPLPLAGIRVLDFSWVIAGPTTTRYLAAMGAEVIKVEAPGRGDPGRASELHSVLGQGKRAIVLDLKRPAGRQLARDLAARADVLVENFATGVMERLGLDAASLCELNPRLIYLSASGFGRTGPDAGRAAYGTLLQCHAGFSGLNGHAGLPLRVGFAWLDPMCGLMLAFAAAAALRRRQDTGAGCRIDFSMLEAMLWTLAGPLLAAQSDRPPARHGNASDAHAPHGIYAGLGEDAWLAVAVTDETRWRALAGLVPGLAPLAGLDLSGRRRHLAEIDRVLAAWAKTQTPDAAAALLAAAGVPAAKVASSLDLVDSPQLAARGFWEAAVEGPSPGLPWRASFGRATGPAPALGADTEAVLTQVLGLAPAEIAALRQAGALG